MRMSNTTRNIWLSVAIAGIGVLAILSVQLDLLSGDYNRFVLAMIAANSIGVLSISIMAGNCGIWSLGHTAFLAIGAYVGSNLAGFGVPIEVILPVVAALAAIVGYTLGIAVGRFSILYFGLLTLAVALTCEELIGRFPRLTGGDQGLLVPPMPSLLFGGSLDPRHGATVSVVLAVICFILALWVINGAPGRRWRAIKSQRTASLAIGLRPALANANAFGFSAALASISGVAIAVTLGYIDTLVFSLQAGIMLKAGAVIGGIGSFAGAAVGAAFIVGVPELSRSFPDMSAFFLGGAMVLTLLWMPRGLWPTMAGLIGRLAAPADARRADRPEHDSLISEPGSIGSLAPAADKTLSVRGLGVSFGGLHALRDISFDVAPGEAVGLIGPNGAGKTTALNLISGFIRPTRCDDLGFGDAKLQGMPPYARLGLGLGRTFQHAELFGDLTVRESLLLARDQRGQSSDAEADRALEDIDEVLREFGLSRYADSRPSELPFGVQKVCDIARALVSGATFLALDEPFSGLDQVETAELRRTLQALKAHGISILIIDHVIQEVFDLVDRVVVLNFGEVLAEGTPDEIRRNPDVQRAYFGSDEPEALPA